MKATYYDLQTGRIVGNSIGPEEDVLANMPEGCAILDDIFESDEYYVEEGVLVQKPSKPADYFQFNYETKSWVDGRSQEFITAMVIGERNLKLANSDWTDTVSAPSRLGLELYGEWQAYRQALRDVPEQPGFPNEVVWPTPPA
jgi:hypothetical protein